jgi:predicted NBD/HSP70 family sugar kinase
MQYLGIEYQMNHAPRLDPDFIPFGVWRAAYLQNATKPIAIAIQRDKGRISVHKTFIHGTPELAEADYRYVERYVKFLLWSIGGFRISVCGCSELTQRLQKAYTSAGVRQFDCMFFHQVYEHELEIIDLPLEQCPAANEVAQPMGGNMNGCRIGFDAGGSDRKVSAVIDGECVYSEEVLWFPKLNEDPTYQYQEILTAFRTAASKMPRVDAIGVSSAGVFIGNAPMVSSIFYKVPRSKWDFVKTVFDRAAAEIDPNIPILVANDGDVSALAGAIGLGKGNLMGLAMGTSEAVGYVDQDQNVLGWINELAFAPVDLQEGAMQDEWSTDFGVGCKYFSQDAVIKLAPYAGIQIPEDLPLAQKLKFVQKLMEADDPRAVAVFETIGAYLAYTTVLYAQFYDLDYVMLLGRVMSGKGGDTILRICNEILADEYPELAAKCSVTLPDEKMRRVGQSVAAASLPEVAG